MISLIAHFTGGCARDKLRVRFLKKANSRYYSVGVFYHHALQGDTVNVVTDPDL